MAYNDSMGSRRTRGAPARQGSRRLAPAKAAEMLHNPPGGKPLSRKQRGLFGAIASRKRTRGVY